MVSASVSSQLPPVLRRQIDDHATRLHRRHHISLVMSFGAGLPGFSAVVTMISTSAACRQNNAISA